MQLLGTLQFNFGIAKLHFEVCNRGLRGIAVGFGRFERAPYVGVIERREQLAFAEARAFVEKDAGDAAVDFGGDGGAG
jgi:hypothetical protein